VEDVSYIRVLDLNRAEVDLHFEIISFRVLFECVFLYDSTTEAYLKVWFIGLRYL